MWNLGVANDEGAAEHRFHSFRILLPSDKATVTQMLLNAHNAKQHVQHFVCLNILQQAHLPSDLQLIRFAELVCTSVASQLFPIQTLLSF